MPCWFKRLARLRPHPSHPMLCDPAFRTKRKYTFPHMAQTYLHLARFDRVKAIIHVSTHRLPRATRKGADHPHRCLRLKVLLKCEVAP